MKLRNPPGFILLGLPVIVLGMSHAIGAMASPGVDDAGDRLREGRDLFLREWRHNDKRSFAGTGLGPVYNAKSCLTCHYQAGIGGSGPGDTNTTMVAVFLEAPAGQPGADALNKVSRSGTQVLPPDRSELAKLHPNLKTANAFLLPEFSDEKEFEIWKSKILSAGGLFLGGNRAPGRLGVTLLTSQRNPPSLLGAGLIDRIPDSVLVALAAEQEKTASESQSQTGPSGIMWVGKKDPNPKTRQFLPIRGRVARLENGKLGRFGWKGSVASLREFTLQACANEIGLEVPGFPRAVPPWIQDYKAPGLDLSADQCDRLTEFVAYLPRPVSRRPEGPAEAADIAKGRELFNSIGCAICHRPKLGNVEEIYSDLLLHDMGTSMSASGSYGPVKEQAGTSGSIPILALATGKETREKPPQFGAGSREWRTPPLWGLADSSPYMHDGRATTIAEAILAHDGEGADASQAFEVLPNVDQKKLIRFLQSLVAPPMPW